jgi:hypothetical protein
MVSVVSLIVGAESGGGGGGGGVWGVVLPLLTRRGSYAMVVVGGWNRVVVDYGIERARGLKRGTILP